MSKDTRALLNAAVLSGLTVVKSKRNSHYKIYSGKRLVSVMSATPSSPSSLRNARSELRRHGVNL